ncbi:hypothetical protein AA309_31450, partial [Microvirga vignae]
MTMMGLNRSMPSSSSDQPTVHQEGECACSDQREGKAAPAEQTGWACIRRAGDYRHDALSTISMMVIDAASDAGARASDPPMGPMLLLVAGATEGASRRSGSAKNQDPLFRTLAGLWRALTDL